MTHDRMLRQGTTGPHQCDELLAGHRQVLPGITVEALHHVLAGHIGQFGQICGNDRPS